MKKLICIILTISILASCFIAVSAQASQDYSQGFPTQNGYYTVVFTNNKGWGNVNIYSWSNETQQATADWPGNAMSYACTNGYGEPQYIAYVPKSCDRIVFNDGSDANKTVDITILGSGAYYLDGDFSPYNVGSFDVVFINPEVPPQPTTPNNTEPAQTDPQPTEPSTGEADPVEKEEPKLTIESKVLYLKAGETAKATVSNANGKAVKYTTSKNKIAKIDKKGNITALQKGTTVISAKIGGKTLKKTVKVTTNPVIKKGKQTVKNNKTVTIKKGKKLTLTINGKVSAINNYVKIKNGKIAKVTSKVSQPKITLKANKKGTTTLTVKINDVKTYKIKIKVN